jgi:hypothetical protein
MADVASTPLQPPKIIPPDHDSTLGATPDPYTPSSASTVSRNDSLLESSSHHPDLNEEISKLNEKLVDSLNHQSSLDESLQQTKHELEAARRMVAKLEAQSQAHNALLLSGLLLRKEDVDCREASIRAELAAEQALRVKAETDKTAAEKVKKAMEQELETLTSALFQEANTMVADARREKEASDKKVDQLKNQLQDSEVLLQSHQEQLSDLKSVLEKITAEQTDAESVTHISTNPPSSPIVATDERMSPPLEAAPIVQNDPAVSEVIPDHPLHFSHLLQPVLRTDVTAFEDFSSLIKQARAASPPPSRVVSGSYCSLNVVGGGSISAGSSQNSPPALPIFPSISGSTSPRNNSTAAPAAPTLRETKVFKRALTEDIEPTLRLDIAPGVSWMVRRPILNSMIEGSLVVEPMPASPVKFRGPVNQCALCGENRTGETYARNHRFRISEDRETRRFPLCDLCLGRIRSCCDLLSFLRMVANGHWRADSDEEVKTAWEEYVKLRERMFWHRMAGGVVPVTSHSKEPVAQSPRPSIITVHGGARKESSEAEDTLRSPSPVTGEISELDISRQRSEGDESGKTSKPIPGSFA